MMKIHRLDELAASVYLSNCSNIKDNFTDILMPPAIDFLLEKRRTLWQKVANIILFCQGHIVGQDWDQWIEGQSPFQISCHITDINFNHYLLPEIISHGLKIIGNLIYNEDDILVRIEVFFYDKN